MAAEVPDISSVFHHLKRGGLAFNGSLRPVRNLLSHNHLGKFSLHPGGGGDPMVMSDCCDPMACSLPGSFVHGISQARTLEWVAIPFSRASSQPRDQTQVYCITGGLLHCRQILY